MYFTLDRPSAVTVFSSEYVKLTSLSFVKLPAGKIFKDAFLILHEGSEMNMINNILFSIRSP